MPSRLDLPPTLLDPGYHQGDLAARAVLQEA